MIRASLGTLVGPVACLGRWGAYLLRCDGSEREQGPSPRSRGKSRQRCSWIGGGRQGPKALRPGSGSNYTRGAWGGMTPTEVKEEGGLWRRKEEKN